MALLRRIIRRAGINLAIRSGWSRRRFGAQRGKLRILTYHGIVPDELRDRSWVPSHYVTVSQFKWQMQALAKLGPCPSLSEAAKQVYTRKPDAPAVCLTFDDGMADNVTLGLPILQEYGHHATFFLATGHLDRGELLFNDIIRLLRPAFRQRRLDRSLDAVARLVLEHPALVKQLSYATLETSFADLWAEYAHLADPDGVRALRTISREQVQQLLAGGMSIGAHTVHHAILARENRVARRREITESIECVRDLAGAQNAIFSYPYGEAGDYDASDLAILKQLHVPFAVTQQHGWNEARTSPLELRRSAVGLHCSSTAFLWEVLAAGEDRHAAPAVECCPPELALPHIVGAPPCS